MSPSSSTSVAASRHFRRKGFDPPRASCAVMQTVPDSWQNGCGVHAVPPALLASSAAAAASRRALLTTGAARAGRKSFASHLLQNIGHVDAKLHSHGFASQRLFSTSSACKVGMHSSTSSGVHFRCLKLCHSEVSASTCWLSLPTHL